MGPQGPYNISFTTFSGNLENNYPVAFGLPATCRSLFIVCFGTWVVCYPCGSVGYRLGVRTFSPPFPVALPLAALGTLGGRNGQEKQHVFEDMSGKGLDIAFCTNWGSISAPFWRLWSLFGGLWGSILGPPASLRGPLGAFGGPFGCIWA